MQRKAHTKQIPIISRQLVAEPQKVSMFTVLGAESDREALKMIGALQLECLTRNAFDRVMMMMMMMMIILI